MSTALLDHGSMEAEQATEGSQTSDKDIDDIDMVELLPDPLIIRHTGINGPDLQGNKRKTNGLGAQGYERGLSLPKRLTRPRSMDDDAMNGFRFAKADVLSFEFPMKQLPPIDPTLPFSTFTKARQVYDAAFGQNTSSDTGEASYASKSRNSSPRETRSKESFISNARTQEEEPQPDVDQDNSEFISPSFPKILVSAPSDDSDHESHNFDPQNADEMSRTKNGLDTSGKDIDEERFSSLARHDQPRPESLDSPPVKVTSNGLQVSKAKVNGHILTNGHNDDRSASDIRETAYLDHDEIEHYYEMRQTELKLQVKLRLRLQELARKTGDVDRLEKQLATVMKENKVIAKHLEESQERIRHYEELKPRLESQISTFEATLETLSEAQVMQREKAAFFEKCQAALSSEKQSLQVTISQLMQSLEATQNASSKSVQEYRSIAESLQPKIESLEGEIVQALKDLRREKERNAQLEIKLQDTEDTANAKFNDRIMKLNETLDLLLAQVQGVAGAVRTVAEQDTGSVVNECFETLSRLADRQVLEPSQLQSFQATISQQLQNINFAVSRDGTELSETFTKTTTELGHSLTTQYQDLASKISESRRSEAEISNHQEEKAVLSSSLQVYKSELESARRDLESARGRIEEDGLKIACLENELSNTKTMTVASPVTLTRVRHLETVNLELQHQQQKTRSACEDTENHLQEKTRQVEGLIQEISAYSVQIDDAKSEQARLKKENELLRQANSKEIEAERKRFSDAAQDAERCIKEKHDNERKQLAAKVAILMQQLAKAEQKAEVKQAPRVSFEESNEPNKAAQSVQQQWRKQDVDELKKNFDALQNIRNREEQKQKGFQEENQSLRAALNGKEQQNRELLAKLNAVHQRRPPQIFEFAKPLNRENALGVKSKHFAHQAGVTAERGAAARRDSKETEASTLRTISSTHGGDDEEAMFLASPAIKNMAIDNPHASIINSQEVAKLGLELLGEVESIECSQDAYSVKESKLNTSGISSTSSKGRVSSEISRTMPPPPLPRPILKREAAALQVDSTHSSNVKKSRSRGSETGSVDQSTQSADLLVHGRGRKLSGGKPRSKAGRKPYKGAFSSSLRALLNLVL